MVENSCVRPHNRRYSKRQASPAQRSILMSALLTYVHSLSMIALGAMLYLLILGFDKLDVREEVFNFLRHAQLAAAAAVIMLASGIALVLWSEHGIAFYLRNPVFWIKIAVFAAMTLVAITPARIMMHWDREIDAGNFPDRASVAFLRRYLTIEVILFLLMPLAGSLVGRAIGLQLNQG